MSDQGNPEDFLLERLNEAASGDAAVRQLRRRYDTLRGDYEQLLGRLGDLEERLNDAAEAVKTAPPPSPIAQSIAEAVAAPLMRLREDYLAAVAGIQSVVSGLEGLAAGFKGQHSTSRSIPVSMPNPPGHTTGATPVPSRPQKTQVEVKGSGFGELLDFQERLTQVPGVSRVSINAIDNERATLVVELDRPPN